MGEQQNEQGGEIKKVAMDILQDERQITFAQILLPRFAHRAVERISPKRLVICPAIIIAGKTKSAGRPQNQKCRGEYQPTRPPGRLAAQQRVGRVTKNFRREKRREIIGAVAAEPVGAVAVIQWVKRRPRRIDDERGKTEKHKERLN